MKKDKKVPILFTGILLAATLGAGASLSAHAVSESSPARAESAPSPVRADFGAMGVTQTIDDALPVAIASVAELGIEAKSTRLVAASQIGSVWAATDSEGRICTITTFKSDPEFASTSCASGEQFNAHGLSTMAATTDEVIEAYLVPDGAINHLPAIESLDGSLTPNLILGDPAANESSLGARAQSESTFPLLILTSNLLEAK